MNPYRRLLKKVMIAFGALLALLIVAAISVPFFIDVDSYRPKIIETANQQIQGKLELGKLKLTLWGKIKIEIDGFSVKDSKGHSVIAAKEVYLHVPWLSILSAAPVVNFKMEKPEVQIIKDKTGKLNALTLVKPTTESEVKPSAEAANRSGGSKSIPSLAARARLGLEMNHAQLSYQDEATGLVSQIKDLNVSVKDLSLSRPTEIEAWAELDTKVATLSVKGPIRLSAKGKPTFHSGSLKDATIEWKVNFDDLEIVMGELFHKKKKVAANAQGRFVLSPEKAKIDEMKAQFFNAELAVNGDFSNLGQTASPQLALVFKTNEVNLASWAELIPMLKDYQISGTAYLSGNARGTMDKLEYEAEGAIKKLSAKAPKLKAEPLIEAGIKIKTDQVETMTLSLKAPGNDLRIQGKVLSFKTPKIDVGVNSTGMDLDALIEFPKTAKKEAGSAVSDKNTAKSGKESNKEDLDASLDSLRKNTIAAATKAKIQMNIAHLKAYDVKMNALESSMSFQDLVLTLDRFKMGLWNGMVTASGGVQMKPKMPTYRFKTQVSALDIKQAVASQFELFKNTLLGTANFTMEASGSSFNPEPAKKNLVAKGNMQIKNATFATIDVSRMAREAVNKAVEGIVSKIPQLKGQLIKGDANTESKYESVTADFTVANGVFQSPNFFAKAEPNRGFDIRGNTQVNIVSYALNTQWEVIDTHNLLKARDVSVEQAGVRVNRLLVDGEKPLTLPIAVGGTVFEPKPNYLAVPEALGKVALTNVQRSVEGKLKSEATKKAQDVLKGLGKKLFGN